jgi:rhodanese-related sulfurtransferase
MGYSEDPTKEKSMSVKQTNPLETNEILQRTRMRLMSTCGTVQEFQAGHVPGSANIPVMSPDPATGRMMPNPNFVKAIEAAFPKDKKLILGCQAGGRSQYAADLLDRAGFQDVSTCRAASVGRKIRWARYRTRLAAIESSGGKVGASLSKSALGSVVGEANFKRPFIPIDSDGPTDTKTETHFESC